MRAALPPARPGARAGPSRPGPVSAGRAALALITVALTVVALTVAGCSPGASDPSAVASASPAPSALGSAPDGSGPPAGGAASPSGAACLDDVGALLRERTTVGARGLVTLLGGSLPCASVGVWVGRFSLDSDPALDPAPQFGAGYTGKRPLAVRIPPATGRCSAAAVFFAAAADGDAHRAAVARAAAEVRSELADWPSGTTAVVPGGTILRGRPSPVLAATVVGDPAACSPGESVSTPVAAVRDCWTALPDTGAATPAATAATVADGATRFRRTTCGEPHTHEVYWAEGLTTRQYLAEGRPAGLGAAAWARRRADEVCARRSTDLALAHDVTRGDIFLELLWPATLTYPPPGSKGWAKAQVVCLVRWRDGRASARHLLHR